MVVLKTDWAPFQQTLKSKVGPSLTDAEKYSDGKMKMIRSLEKSHVIHIFVIVHLPSKTDYNRKSKIRPILLKTINHRF